MAKGTILGTYGASAFLLISLQAGLSLLAAHNINCARKSSDSIETITSSLQKVGAPLDSGSTTNAPNVIA